ncbi:MAG: OST-HTH/LOTUS domain-containing protein, partial [Phormidesmis sp.]
MTSFLAALSRFIRRLFHVDSYGRSRHPSERHPSERHPSERHLSERPSADRPSQYAANGRVATLETSPPTAALATATAERSVLGSALEAAGAVSDKTPAATADMRRLVYKATYNMPKRRMHAGQFGSRLRKIEPAFTYEKYNFTKLIYLLAAVPDIVSLERVNKQGAAPAYYVRAVLDIKRQLLRVMESFDSEDGWVHVESVIAEMARTVPE